jgi:hypothetical protein
MRGSARLTGGTFMHCRAQPFTGDRNASAAAACVNRQIPLGIANPRHCWAFVHSRGQDAGACVHIRAVAGKNGGATDEPVNGRQATWGLAAAGGTGCRSWAVVGYGAFVPAQQAPMGFCS